MKHKYLSLGLLESQGYRANHFMRVWKENQIWQERWAYWTVGTIDITKQKKQVMVYLAVLMNKGISGELPKIKEMEIFHTLVREKDGGHSLEHSQK